MAHKAFISGCASTALTDDERSFFADERPWGLILFARNCETREQVSDLVESFRFATDSPNAPVLIDQEGGRVQRLGPPHWPSYPAPGRIAKALNGHLAGLDVFRAHGRLLASDLDELGITVDCVPCADLLQPDGHKIISDRAFGSVPKLVAERAWAQTEGLMDGGVLPVLKHMPGHGRATVDSHLELPVVSTPRSQLDETDFAVFKALGPHFHLGMTAHVVFSDIDPENPATLSARVISDVIRAHIGFDGLLMTDDLSMKALGGGFDDRTRRALEAGCDIVLHCNGDMDEMQAVASAVPDLAGRSLERANTALASRGRAQAFNRADAEAAIAVA